MAIKWNTAALEARANRAAMRGIVRATEMLREEIITLILDTPKTGRIYTRRGVAHQASAPGEPPAVDRGEHLNSIRTEYDTSRLAGRVVISAAHALPLEYGTQKMAPRPVMRIAVANKAKAMQDAVAEELAKEFGK